ncbi:MAG TPA: sulfatase-like hydrolase/transferase [Acidobacteriaceae bacterium]|jgi:hypothetical protein|nr:sulfatase-like hydrolase/transferase [Acidobacteriaceae bacterium]
MLKRLCQCIGLASLMLVVNYNDLLNGGENARMHVPYRLTGVCWAQIADIVLLGLVFFAVRELLHRTKYYAWARLLVMIFAPPYLIERSRTLIPINLKDGVLVLLTVVWAAIVLFFVLESPRWYRNAIRVGDAVGIFAAVFAVFSIAQIVAVMTWRPGPQEIRASWQRGAQPPRVHPRMVWILFDELSYDQTFEHRAHDVALPNFDALRNQSTLYTDVQPVGYKTVKVIPSLFSGAEIDDFQYHFNNKLLVHYVGTHGWHALDGNGTVFHDAQQAGWRTAVVGWYNPYCTIYKTALDSCYWTYLDGLGVDMAQGTDFWGNAWRPLKEMGTQLYSPGRAADENCNFNVRQRLATHLDLEKHMMALLADDHADFIYLHVAIPHPPNIWSREDGAYVETCGSSYLDSLALADRELGMMMAELEESPRWKDTTVIVEGDHSWRVALWDWLPGWTDEDEQASHDVFDPRPALLIHAAGQTQPETDARAVPLMVVHQVVEDVLQGKAVQP